jgi:bla regulator protein BlaR1
MQALRFCSVFMLVGLFFLAAMQGGFAQSLPAQTPSQQTSQGTSTASLPLPVYEVSTLRPAAAGPGDRHVWTRLNTLDVKNMPLIALLKGAFDVPEDMIVGLPEWAKHTQLDIEAKTLEEDTARLRDLTAAQRRAMMLALLEDRLGLKWHYETRVLPSYDLYVGKDGAKLKLTVATNQNSGISVNDTRFRLTNIPVSDLAVVLSDKLGRPVVDKTGLAGRYDVALEWSSDQTPVLAPDAPPPLMTVLQEQLGLRLRSATDPVQVFVIDRLTPPLAN